MSSINYIHFDNIENPLFKKISEFVQDTIEKIEEEKKENKIKKKMKEKIILINFIMDNIPTEFLSPIHHLFYDFFNYLAIEIKRNFYQKITFR